MSISIVNYSEKAIAVFGNTKDIKDHLSALGGKFNPSLKQNDERVPGWVFPTSKKEEVRKIITAFSQGTLGEPPKKVEKASSASNTTETFTFSKEMFLSLVSRIEKLEAELEISKKTIEKLAPSSHPVDKVKLKFSSNEELYDEDEPKVYKSLFKSKSS